MHLAAVEALQHGPATLAVWAVARDAVEVLEELLARRRHRAFAAAAASHAWYSAGSITTTCPTIPECFVPQYCAQKK